MKTYKCKIKNTYNMPGCKLNKIYDCGKREDGIVVFTSPDWLLFDFDDIKILN